MSCNSLAMTAPLTTVSRQMPQKLPHSLMSIGSYKNIRACLPKSWKAFRILNNTVSREAKFPNSSAGDLDCFDMSCYNVQVMIGILCVLVNGYCVTAVCVEKPLRSMDYSLVVLQSIFDLIFSGVGTALFYSIEIYVDYQELCYEARGGTDEVNDDENIFQIPECVKLQADSELRRIGSNTSQVLTKELRYIH